MIGAGATATAEFDWYDKWAQSKEAAALQRELERIHAEGRSRPVVGATFRHEFATPWAYQVAQLFRRHCAAHWRDPTYILAKIALNIIAGLAHACPRDVAPRASPWRLLEYAHRDRRALGGRHVALNGVLQRAVASSARRSSPCWYWTVGFPSLRGGYTYLLLAVTNPFYQTTIGHFTRGHLAVAHDQRERHISL